ncbi:MAG: hypothetical protein DI626_04275 [Micavibrio aeruginosavorus]|uniref:Uncharacterized protein n=1 Tax=Micavibrio aeruginosavorus TaxID=349221 RepID=A0A2W5BZY7_9BACT|nr:MAG: hypothetical protein DI626_04275 [Micavibrio aeruginosavorus]
MFYKDLRFQGFYLHEEESYRKALTIVTVQNDDSKDHLRPPPDDAEAKRYNQYQEDVSTFGEEYKQLGEELLKDAKAGRTIDAAAIKTLERAEFLYSQANAVGPKTAFNAAQNLEKGKGAGGHGFSLTKQVRDAAGLEDRETAYKRDVSVTFRPF